MRRGNQDNDDMMASVVIKSSFALTYLSELLTPYHLSRSLPSAFVVLLSASREAWHTPFVLFWTAVRNTQPLSLQTVFIGSFPVRPQDPPLGEISFVIKRSLLLYSSVLHFHPGTVLQVCHDVIRTLLLVILL